MVYPIMAGLLARVLSTNHRRFRLSKLQITQVYAALRDLRIEERVRIEKKKRKTIDFNEWKRVKVER